MVKQNEHIATNDGDAPSEAASAALGGGGASARRAFGLTHAVITLPMLLGCGGGSPATPTDAGVDGSAPPTSAVASVAWSAELAIRATSARNVVVRWQAQAEGEVRVERATGSSADFVEIARRSRAAGRLLDVALQPEAIYRYRLSLCDVEACGAPVILGPIMTPPSHVPAFDITVPAQPGCGDDLILFSIPDQDLTGNSDGMVVVMDRTGTILWEQFWPGRPANAVRPIRGHRLALTLRALLTIVDLDGSTLAQYPDIYVTHDVRELADGTLAALSWDLFEDPPGFSIVGDAVRIFASDLSGYQWEWRGRDHISLSDQNAWDFSQTYFDLGHDWTHFNSFAVDESKGMIYVNARNLNRVYAISYPTGEVRWIMGDGGDFGGGLWGHSHDLTMLADDRAMMLDNGMFQAGGNGVFRPGGETYSRALEVQFDPVAKTASTVWEYRETPDFFTPMLGGVAQLKGGTVLLTDGMNGRILEVSREKQKLWEVRFPSWYWIYRAAPLERSFLNEW